MRKKLHFFYDESGAATVVESTIIIPIVFMTLGFLIFLNFYLLEKTAFTAAAEEIAQVVSRIKASPGYYQIDGTITPTDFSDVTDDKIIETLVISEPYRYWKLDIPYKEEWLHKAQQLIDKSIYVKGSKVNLSIECRQNFLEQDVLVTLTKKVFVPNFFTALGISSAFTIEAKACQTVNDSPEFIRNTDIVFDLASTLNEHYEISDKVAAYGKKTMEVLRSLKGASK